jgi:hypothetical protein
MSASPLTVMVSATEATFIGVDGGLQPDGQRDAVADVV